MQKEDFLHSPLYTARVYQTGVCRIDGNYAYQHLERECDHAFTIYIGLLQGYGKNILVDTGMVSVDAMNAMAGFLMTEQITQQPGEDTLSIIRRAGLTPEQIDYILLTHCHYDHCSNAVLFPNATVVVPQTAWDAWQADPKNAVYLHLGFLDYLDELHRTDRLLPLDHGWVTPGIAVQRVGGHSLCSQFVYAHTARGVAVFTGDTVQMFANLEKNDIIAICEDEGECWQALETARSTADLVVPGHDPRVLEVYPGGIVG